MFRSKPPTHHSFSEGASARNYPEGFPSGWYHLIDLDELRPGESRALDCLGKHFVVFRGEDSGRYRVLDAHCPHQGASLAGGEVCGDEIACPFHKWRFDGEGCLSHIPGSDKLPRVGVQSYPVREHCGMLWMYHDVSGRAVETPPYEPEVIPDIASGQLRPRGNRAPQMVRMHLSEFIENSVDFQHFAHIHGQLTIPWTTIPVPGMYIEHDADWEIDEAEPHKAYFKNFAYLRFRNRHLRKSGAHALITLFGPGGTVWFRFTLPDLGDIVMFQTHLPRGATEQETRFRWFADPKVPRPLVWYVVGNWISQWKADLDIWENKVFRSRPVLIDLDGPVHKMRRWYARFYESELESGGTDEIRRLPIAR